LVLRKQSTGYYQNKNGDNFCPVRSHAFMIQENYATKLSQHYRTGFVPKLYLNHNLIGLIPGESADPPGATILLNNRKKISSAFAFAFHSVV